MLPLRGETDEKLGGRGKDGVLKGVLCGKKVQKRYGKNRSVSVIRGTTVFIFSCHVYMRKIL